MTTTIFNRNVDTENRFGRMRGNLARILIVAGALAIGAVVLFNVLRVTRINAGYVGVEVNLAGSQRGAQDIPIRTGWVFFRRSKRR